MFIISPIPQLRKLRHTEIKQLPKATWRVRGRAWIQTEIEKAPFTLRTQLPSWVISLEALKPQGPVNKRPKALDI